MNTDKPSYRRDRVAKLLSDALSKVLDQQRGFMNLPLITINYIKMSPDLKLAKVYFSFYKLGVDVGTESEEEVIKYEQQVEKNLNSHSKLLRREITRRVYLKSIPELRFYYDQLLREADKVISLIDESKKQ